MFSLEEFKVHFATWALLQEPFERALGDYTPESREAVKKQYPTTECGRYILIPYTESNEARFIAGLTPEALKFDNYASSEEWEFNRLIGESGYPFKPEKGTVTDVTVPTFFTDSLYDK